MGKFRFTGMREYDYPHSNALLQFTLKLEHWKLHKAPHRPTKCHVINDFKLFLTVYCRIYRIDILLQIFYVIQSNVALQKQVH